MRTIKVWTGGRSGRDYSEFLCYGHKKPNVCKYCRLRFRCYTCREDMELNFTDIYAYLKAENVIKSNTTQIDRDKLIVYLLADDLLQKGKV